MKGGDEMEVVRAIARRCRETLEFCIGAVAILAAFVLLVLLYDFLIDGAIKAAVMALAACAVYVMLFL